MKERPILFNGEMVRAILDGRKTQTRRPIKPQPAPPNGWYPDRYAQERNWTFWGPRGTSDSGRCSPLFAAPVVPGDRLWVRETFGQNVAGCKRGISYRADHRDPRGDGPAHPMRWMPSIHMPRWASRLTLEVTDVRVQRVEDITEADAIAEGFGCIACTPAEPCARHMPESPSRADFLDAWRSIYGPGNPWVWAITFRRVP